MARTFYACGSRFPIQTAPGFSGLSPSRRSISISRLTASAMTFATRFRKLLAAAKVSEFAKFVRARANERNRLLYATTEGIPKVGGNIKSGLDVTRGRVMAELAVYLLIDTVKSQQQFVTQCLEAFLRLMELIPDEANERQSAS